MRVLSWDAVHVHRPAGAQVVYELDAPPFMAEVTGTVSRVEDFAAFVEFKWNGKTLTGFLAREEMKVSGGLAAAAATAVLCARTKRDARTCMWGGRMQRPIPNHGAILPI